MSQDAVRESLGTDLSKVLLRDILGVRKYWCQLSSKQWSREYGQHVANMYLHSHPSVSFIYQGIVKIDNATVRLLFHYVEKCQSREPRSKSPAVISNLSQFPTFVHSAV